jgi:hypothetical protein
MSWSLRSSCPFVALTGTLFSSVVSTSFSVGRHLTKWEKFPAPVDFFAVLRTRQGAAAD